MPPLTLRRTRPVHAGQTLAEYGLVGALVLVVLIPAVMLMSGNIQSWFASLQQHQKQSIAHTEASLANIESGRKNWLSAHSNDPSYVMVDGRLIKTDSSASILVSGGGGQDIALSLIGLAAMYKESNPALFNRLNDLIRIQRDMNNDMLNFKGGWNDFYPAMSNKWLKNAADYKYDFVTSAEFKSMPPECQAYILKEYRILYEKSFAFARNVCYNKNGMMCGQINVFQEKYKV